MGAFSQIVLDDTSNDPIAKVIGQINANFSLLGALVATPNAPAGTPNSSAQTLFSPYDYGCKIDGINKSDITTKSASKVISSASHNFSAGDVGKLITIAGAGAAAGGAECFDRKRECSGSGDALCYCWNDDQRHRCRNDGH